MRCDLVFCAISGEGGFSLRTELRLDLQSFIQSFASALRSISVEAEIHFAQSVPQAYTQPLNEYILRRTKFAAERRFSSCPYNLRICMTNFELGSALLASFHIHQASLSAGIPEEAISLETVQVSRLTIAIPLLPVYCPMPSRSVLG